ncbi:signal peptide peptidase SppA [Leptodesmis sp.]|uniref:signal peptide peptidase SppA n=1 Tax=Leptodesmis sp. TaxID=3100501 RepID=UPI004053478C
MRDFLKYTLASLLALLIFMGVSIGGFLSLVILLASRDPGPKVKDKSVLTFDLSTQITDSRSTEAGALEETLTGDSKDSIPLRSVLDAINQAAQDKRIVGIYLYGDTSQDGVGAGYATLKEVREALQRFRAAGKQIFAYDVNWRESEYYLASAANTIAINPFGSVEMNGLSSETTFFAGALQKFGIGMQVTRVGKYKSAVEPFLLTRRSPESREQTQQLIGDLWNEFLVTVGKDRKLSPQQLQSVVDSEGILEPAQALKRGLVTKQAYEDEIITQLKQLTGQKENDKTFRQISLKSYAKVAQEKLQKGRKANKTIAVLYAEGEIVDGDGDSDQVGGSRFAQQLRELRQDDDVKAVVLRVNSPGGSVTASDQIQREVILTRKVKPVIVSMGSVAASGGYWISTYSDRIFAEPNTITGSIGVFGLRPNIQKLANNNGITWDVVKTGRFADMLTLSRPRTPEELALMQKSVDRIYKEFLGKVADSRKLPKAKVAEIAQGRVWSGKKAKAIGLVDDFGGLQVAIQEAAKRAKLGNDWRLEEYPRPRSLGQQLLENFSDSAAKVSGTKDPLTREFKKLQADLWILRALNDPMGIYARLPYNIRID